MQIQAIICVIFGTTVHAQHLLYPKTSNSRNLRWKDDEVPSPADDLPLEDLKNDSNMFSRLLEGYPMSYGYEVKGSKKVGVIEKKGGVSKTSPKKKPKTKGKKGSKGSKSPGSKGSRQSSKSNGSKGPIHSTEREMSMKIMTRPKLVMAKGQLSEPMGPMTGKSAKGSYQMSMKTSRTKKAMAKGRLTGSMGPMMSMKIAPRSKLVRSKGQLSEPEGPMTGKSTKMSLSKQRDVVKGSKDKAVKKRSYSESKKAKLILSMSF